jgi:Ca2+:H+ antiporter
MRMATSTEDHDFQRLPRWSLLMPLAGAVLVGLKLLHLLPEAALWPVLLAVPLLGAAIFAAVHHAEVLALKVGEPFGSVLLALAITVMEVAVILSVMASGTADSEAVARDTVFAAVMIVLNGVVGICLVVGGLRHHEQGFRADGAAAILGVLATIATITLVMPNFTLAEDGPFYAPAQLIFVGGASLVLYAVFLFVQTSRHRDYFLDAGTEVDAGIRPGSAVSLAAAVMLALSLAVVILLAKALTPAVEQAVSKAGLPVSFVGVVIAAVILLPEATAALRAASRNRLQTSLNAALGSALASISLTIPVVAAASLILGTDLVLGLNAEGMTLLLLTLFISSLTLATGRTTILQGAVHLVIFGLFLLLSAIP